MLVSSILWIMVAFFTKVHFATRNHQASEGLCVTNPAERGQQNAVDTQQNAFNISNAVFSHGYMEPYQVWNYSINLSFAVAAMIWYVQSCFRLKYEASVSAMLAFIGVGLLTVLGASLRSFTPGAYILHAFPFLALFKWVLHWYQGQALHHHALKGVKEQFAIGVLLVLLGDRRWIFDAVWDHPYDPVVPITSNPTVLRIWQQTFFVVVWICLIIVLLESGKPVRSSNLPGSGVTLSFPKWRTNLLSFVPLTGVVVAMAFLYISDLMMWCMLVLAYFFGFAALVLEELDDDFPGQTIMHAMLSFIYIFSGLNKCSKPVTENGDVFFHETLRYWVPGLDYYTHTPSARLAIGRTTVFIQVSCGLLLLFVRGRCQKVAAAMLCSMHGVLVCSWWLSPNWVQKGGWVIPSNFGFPMILMTVLVSSTSRSPKKETEIERERERERGHSLSRALLWVTASIRYCFKKHWIVLGLRILYVCAFTLFFIVGPTLYLIPTRPLWPDNGQMSFSMWGNTVRYTIKVSSPASSAAQEHGMWQYVNYGEFNSEAFYDKRFSIAGSVLYSGMFDHSERSQLKLAEWLSKQLGVKVSLEAESKAQFGYVKPKRTLLTYQCAPVCIPNFIERATRNAVDV